MSLPGIWLCIMLSLILFFKTFKWFSQFISGMSSAEEAEGLGHCFSTLLPFVYQFIYISGI